MQDVFRQSTRIGLPALRASMKAAIPRPRRLSLWDALASGDGLTHIRPWPREALSRAYKRTADKDWERVESAAMAAQGLAS